MKLNPLFLAAALMFSAAACSPSQQPASGVATPIALPSCNGDQLLAPMPDADEVASHRLGSMPVVNVPFGTQKESWNFGIQMRVDEKGQPMCYSATTRPDTVVRLQEAQALRLAALRYRPFLSDGKATPVVVYEVMLEEEMPGKNEPTPQVPLESVRIKLERTGCFGRCPGYEVEVRGDGSVSYTGKYFVDVEGKHSYKIPVADVAKLIESLRAKDLWSRRSSYRAEVTDYPTNDLTIDLDGKIKRIEDYAGERIGMPMRIRDFQNEVDAVTQARSWIRLSPVTVDRLEAEGFNFKSQEGGRLLARAKASGADPAAIARLIELGAPLDVEAELGKAR